MKNIVHGFLTSFVVALIILVFIRADSDIKSAFTFVFIFTLLVGLSFSLAIFGIRTAGVALFQDFLEGNALDKILIIFIVIGLAYRIFL